ncbi:hypothetical protein SAMN05216382_1754 [Sphingomonas palmae]|uniref:Uncharacterized protein n=2 Tax=Sphingomonas palmae TaxID=1855283 RepID=A0A1H7P4F3_9SPHN|nr:hypothetical protein SAMN05216382_1754 [Sphingomonas palmae]
MTAKRRRMPIWAAQLVLGCVCGLALLGVSPAAGMKRLAAAWHAPAWLSVEWPDAGRMMAALPSPHVSVRVIVEVQP